MKTILFIGRFINSKKHDGYLDYESGKKKHLTVSLVGFHFKHTSPEQLVITSPSLIFPVGRTAAPFDISIFSQINSASPEYTRIEAVRVLFLKSESKKKATQSLPGKSGSLKSSAASLCALYATQRDRAENRIILEIDIIMIIFVFSFIKLLIIFCFVLTFLERSIGTVV